MHVIVTALLYEIRWDCRAAAEQSKSVLQHVRIEIGTAYPCSQSSETIYAGRYEPQKTKLLIEHQPRHYDPTGTPPIRYFHMMDHKRTIRPTIKARNCRQSREDPPEPIVVPIKEYSPKTSTRRQAETNPSRNREPGTKPNPNIYTPTPTPPHPAISLTNTPTTACLYSATRAISSASTLAYSASFASDSGAPAPPTLYSYVLFIIVFISPAMTAPGGGGGGCRMGSGRCGPPNAAAGGAVLNTLEGVQE